MLVKLCHHLKENGSMCRLPPLRGRIYCHFHQELHRRQGRRMRNLRRRQPVRTFLYCRHVKEDGIPCGSPPLRGESYCHFHLRYKGYPLRTWRNRRRLGGLHFTRSMAFNLNAAQATLKRVERMLASGTCSDPARARMIRCALQMQIHDLRFRQAEGNIGRPTSGSAGR